MYLFFFGVILGDILFYVFVVGRILTGYAKKWLRRYTIAFIFMCAATILVLFI